MKVQFSLLGMFTFLLFSPLPRVEAQAGLSQARPTVAVPPAATIKGDRILLGEIATITSRYEEQKPLVEALRKVDLGEAPAPRMTKNIPGVQVLEHIERTNIPRDAFMYSIPQVVILQRDGRSISKEEVLAAVRDDIAKDSSLDIQVREVEWANNSSIPLGDTKISVEKLGHPSAGKLPLRVQAIVDGQLSARFVATALVDDWRQVPVLTRSIDRGRLIAPDDVELVRLNLYQQPSDVAEKLDDVVGKLAKHRLSAGETIRTGLLDIPPMIPEGKRVLMIFRSGGLTASATGVAIEDGVHGKEIRVRNENSKKVVKAKIINAEEVEVFAQ